MAVVPIRSLPDPILRKKAKRISSVDRSVQRLIGDMLETMHAASGAGLAAPQVGVSLRLVVIGIPGEEDIVLINPEVVRRSGERVVEEGCLSIPGYMGEVKRCENITVKGTDREGKKVRLKGTELLAQALEHEIDHLDGVLYIDHLEGADKFHKNEPPPEPEPAASATVSPSSES